MKKLITIIILLSGFFANSQECISDTSLKEPGYVPEVIPDAIVEEPYSQDITIRIIKDSTMMYNGFPVTVTFDSIILYQVDGLPPSFDYVCFNPNCSFVPDTGRCIRLFGNPQIGDEGVYPLTFHVTAYVKIFGTSTTQSDTLNIYSITISDDPNAGVSLIKTEVFHIYPNPAQDILYIKSSLDIDRLSVCSIDGKEIFCQKASQSIDVSTLSNGLYLVKLRASDGSVYYQKVIINKQ